MSLNLTLFHGSFQLVGQQWWPIHYSTEHCDGAIFNIMTLMTLLLPLTVFLSISCIFFPESSNLVSNYHTQSHHSLPLHSSKNSVHLDFSFHVPPRSFSFHNMVIMYYATRVFDCWYT